MLKFSQEYCKQMYLLLKGTLEFSQKIFCKRSPINRFGSLKFLDSIEKINSCEMYESFEKVFFQLYGPYYFPKSFTKITVVPSF